MIKMEYIDCPFCDQQLQQSSTIYLPCYEKQDIINNKLCGTVKSYGIASEYADFHENGYKIYSKEISLPTNI